MPTDRKWYTARTVAAIAALALAVQGASGALAGEDGTVLVPAGSYQPFFARKGAAGKVSRPLTPVPAFRLDRTPVTNEQFRTFLITHPQWRKSRVPAVFAEAHYLERWPDDLGFGGQDNARRPVTGVSWFAAQAYCEAQGKSLPTTDQWEYALDDKGRDRDAVRQRVLAWYGKPNQSLLPTVDEAPANGFGVAGLAGLIWEWTADFAAALAGPELRNSGGKDQALFCGGASTGASDGSDYASFMRYSFRASLKATYTTDNLGFRCAKEVRP